MGVGIFVGVLMKINIIGYWLCDVDDLLCYYVMEILLCVILVCLLQLWLFFLFVVCLCLFFLLISKVVRVVVVWCVVMFSVIDCMIRIVCVIVIVCRIVILFMVCS